jgi:hypothetical protein
MRNPGLGELQSTDSWNPGHLIRFDPVGNHSEKEILPLGGVFHDIRCRLNADTSEVNPNATNPPRPLSSLASVAERKRCSSSRLFQATATTR